MKTPATGGRLFAPADKRPWCQEAPSQGGASRTLTCLNLQADKINFLFFFLVFKKKFWKQNLHQFHHDFNNFFLISYYLSSTVDPTLFSCKSTSRMPQNLKPQEHIHSNSRNAKSNLPLRSLGSPPPPPPMLSPSQSPCLLHSPQSSANPPSLQLRSSAHENDL